MSMYTQSPTEKQIAFADAIAEALELDFPQSSNDYSKGTYRDFISANVQEYYDWQRSNDYTDDEPGFNDYCWGFSHSDYP